MSNADSFNARRFVDKPGTYEVWYLTWNDPATDCGYWLRYIIEQPDSGPLRGELWFARFDPRDPARTFGIHKHWDRIESHSSPFEVLIGGASLKSDAAEGALEGDGHKIKWSLKWPAAAEPLLLYPDLAYRFSIGPTTALWPNPGVALTGELVVDGERISLSKVRSSQAHLWGKKHGYAWAWAHCADFDNADDGVLEFIAGRLHRRGITLPPLSMVVLHLDGERHELNQFRHTAVNRSSWSGNELRFVARSTNLKIEGHFVARPEEMIVAPYEDPDGTEVFCSNTEIGTVRVTLYKRAGLGWREYRTLLGTRRGHFEVGGRTRDPDVTREHVLVR